MSYLLLKNDLTNFRNSILLSFKERKRKKNQESRPVLLTVASRSKNNA